MRYILAVRFHNVCFICSCCEPMLKACQTARNCTLPLNDSSADFLLKNR